jgi:hypothetical protein
MSEQYINDKKSTLTISWISWLLYIPFSVNNRWFSYNFINYFLIVLNISIVIFIFHKGFKSINFLKSNLISLILNIVFILYILYFNIYEL